MTDRSKILKIAVRKFAPFELSVEKAWRHFCKQTGCDLMLEMQPMDLPQLYRSTVLEKGLANGSWDIAHISSDWITEVMTANAAEDLCSPATADNIGQALDQWPASLIRRQVQNGRLFGIPFHDGPECLIYRRDLFDNKAYQTNFKKQFGYALKPPRTWESFLDIAVFFGDCQRDLWGTALAAYPDGHNAVYDFCIHVWTRGGSIIGPDGKINIHSPAAADGLKFYRSFFQQERAIHPSSKQLDSVQLGTAFAKGEIAMMINWFGFAAYAELNESSLVKGKIDIAPIPHGPAATSVSPNSYWMYCIGKGSSIKQTAYDFIRFVTDTEQDKALTLNGGIGCRIETWHSKEINDRIPYFYKLEALHRSAIELPDVPSWHKVAKVIDSVMLKVVNTSEPVTDILQETQHYIDKLS